MEGGGSHWPGRTGRLYKTDGSLTFIGRRDAQVKIRGQRVELGEVSYRVQEILPEIIRAIAEVVTPRGSGSSPQLAVFLEVGDRHDPVHQTAAVASIFPITPGVGAKLAEHLPSYIVLSLA